ncbi:MAG: serine protease [Sumerlaeia bacterium]
MNPLRPVILAAALATFAGAAIPARAADIHETAREVLESHGGAVVTVDVVREINQSEDRAENQGLVVDESGKVVMALSQIDPSALYELLSGSREADFTTTVKDIKYILPDGTEIPATILVRDRDLDIAVLAPKEPLEEALPYVDLNDSAEAKVMDPIFAISRTGRITRRIALGMTGEVQGIVDRPRQFYIPSASIVGDEGNIGSPVFGADGKILGLILLHVQPGAFNDPTATKPVIPVVRPVADLLEVVAQAENATPEDIGGETEEASDEEMEETGDAEDIDVNGDMDLEVELETE